MDIHLHFDKIAMFDKTGYNANDFTPADFKIKSIKLVKNDNAIIYNNKIKLINVPTKAYEYKLMNKPVINLFINKWRLKTDSKANIVNDPNDYAQEIGNPRYILETLLRVINICLQTTEIVDNLPDVDFNDPDIYEKLS